ncbi:hypothetical protein SAMN00777080_2569 [Aquiflexum balticum DSM 16537]|uniref:Uncharacterized protein n=1 Tax=Aquiflexum balticum DSM 16537 TaxID=758820 RepID=A0A1W2H633_9BACT|nr:hypothetical protein SAMN00777080_2569 [Aquiflexum balticum DSM 16537]
MMEYRKTTDEGGLVQRFAFFYNVRKQSYLACFP